MRNAVLVDAGPLIALLDQGDKNHQSCQRALSEIEGSLVSVWPVVTEAAYFLGKISAKAQDALLEMIEEEIVEIAELDIYDISRARELMAKYSDLPMDFADAALLRVAEREKIASVFTIDKRDFSLYRPKHVSRLKILP